MTTRIQQSAPLACALALALLVVPAATVTAGETIELDESDVFIEFNATDGDFGIHFFWDGEAWKSMTVKGPNGANAKSKSVLSVKAKKNVKQQGLTEAFFESQEPTLDELSMEEFLERFPEGEYTFKGKGTEKGVKLTGEADFTHDIPAAPENLSPAADAMVDVSGGLVVSCDAVTTDLDGDPIVVEFYEVVLETEDVDELERIFSMLVRGDVPSVSVTIPPEFLVSDQDYKLEVVVEEESGNRTASETEFTTL